MTTEPVEGLQIRDDGAVITVTIDRGEENLLSLEMCRALTALLHTPPEDAHVLRLRADGPAFCLGRDRGDGSVDDLRGEVRVLIDLNEAIRTTELVTVAEVQADADGFGVGLAALCDASFMAEGAHLRFPEIDIDLAPVVVLTWLPRMIGRAAAFDLTATGRALTGAEAASLGLVGSAVPDTELAATVAAWVVSITSHSRRVHREILDYLRASEGLDDERGYALAVDRLVLGSMRRRR